VPLAWLNRATAARRQPKSAPCLYGRGRPTGLYVALLHPGMATHLAEALSGHACECRLRVGQLREGQLVRDAPGADTCHAGARPQSAAAPAAACACPSGRAFCAPCSAARCQSGFTGVRWQVAPAYPDAWPAARRGRASRTCGCRRLASPCPTRCGPGAHAPGATRIQWVAVGWDLWLPARAASCSVFQ
jgi:hypothetical protein